MAWLDCSFSSRVLDGTPDLAFAPSCQTGISLQKRKRRGSSAHMQQSSSFKVWAACRFAKIDSGRSCRWLSAQRRETFMPDGPLHPQMLRGGRPPGSKKCLWNIDAALECSGEVSLREHIAKATNKTPIERYTTARSLTQYSDLRSC